ncbi:MAG: NAD(P)-dependent alcohol dehydrogenase [Candidatus Thorarchaeota archaeon]
MQNMEINAMAALNRRENLVPWKYAETEVKEYDILIDIICCGVCYSDIHMIDNDWGSSKYPLVPGHEIIGIVRECGNSVTHLRKGDKVGVGWQRSSCLTCETCLAGNENMCSVNYHATIVNHHGGYATSILTDSRFAFKIPEGMDSYKTAPLLCGGITVYSGLKIAGMTSGQEIGVIGLGGLGHMAVLFAKSLGNKVTVFTTSEDKEEFAITKLGANNVINTKNEIPRNLSSSLDVIINTVDHPLPWQNYIRLLREDGTLCFVGNPGDLNVPISLLLGKRRRIMGSPIGGRARIREMLLVANKFNVNPFIQKFPLNDVNDALKNLRENKIRFRAVLVNK